MGHYGPSLHLFPYFVHASIEGSGKTVFLHIFILEAIYTGDVSPKFLYTRYRVENPGKCWLTLHIAIKDMDKRVYQTFVF